MSSNRFEFGWAETVVTVSSWRLFLAICTLPALAASIALCFFPESPRFLLAKNRHDDALQVFKRIYACNTGKDLDSYPVSNFAIVLNASIKNCNYVNHFNSVRDSEIMKKLFFDNRSNASKRRSRQSYRVLLLRRHWSVVSSKYSPFSDRPTW